MEKYKEHIHYLNVLFFYVLQSEIALYSLCNLMPHEICPNWLISSLKILVVTTVRWLS